MKLLIASNNEHKIREIKTILHDYFETIVSVKEFGVTCDPEETGETFYENALIKAKELSKIVNGYAILADDTGLCVNALNGLPGIHSARYAGDHDSAKNRQSLLKNLQFATDRSAYFKTVAVLLYPNGKTLVGEGQVNGYITEQEIGNTDFGYDCIFYSTELNKTFGEASDEEKNSVSHRARALHNLIAQLSNK